MNELVLVVDDEPKIVKLAQDYLERGGFGVVTAKDGTMALAVARHEHPDLIVLDLNLPGLDGYQVLQRMKEDDRTKRIPVIILTTTDDTREVIKCYNLGCNVYITKPVDYEKFSEAIRKIGLFLSVVTIPNGE